MKDRTGNMLHGTITTIEPRPACPPWCAPDACELEFAPGEGWSGAHADALEMIVDGPVWRSVQIRAFVSADGSGDTAPGVHLDGSADGIDAMTAFDAEQIAAALLAAALKVRTAARLTVIRAA